NTARKILDPTAVKIATGKIHCRIAGIVAQISLDQADAFKEIRPVGRGNSAHRGDDIAQSDVRGALSFLCVADDSVDIRSLRRQSLLKPAERGIGARIAV